MIFVIIDMKAVFLNFILKLTVKRNKSVTMRTGKGLIQYEKDSIEYCFLFCL